MDRITLRIESVGENEHVSLDDFVAQLVAIRAALERTDAAMNAGQQTLIWEVVGLSHSSPATIELEPRTRRRANAAIAAPSEVIRTFTSSLQALALDKAPPRELDNAAIAAFRALAAPVAANRVQSAIHTPNETIPIVKTIETAAARVIEEDLQSTGTFKGLLEFLNIHGRKSEFRWSDPIRLIHVL